MQAQDNMPTPFIELRNVEFSYEDRLVLGDVTLCIYKGEFTAIMGGSGSGKTTLMRLITGQLKPDYGQVLVNGRDLSVFSVNELADYRRNMGVLFQQGALFTDLSVFDNVAFPMRELTELPEYQIFDLTLLKLNAVGLHGTEQYMPSELSGGMARRVALARTIALDPTLLLYDEPFTGLDPVSLGVVAHLMHRVNTTLHSTSIMVTHDVDHSLNIADKVVFLAHGEILFSGTPQEIRQSNLPWVKQFVGGLPDGPVPFHYPAKNTIYETLLGSFKKTRCDI